MQLVVLGVAANRRAAYVCEAATRRGWPPPRVVDYREVLRSPQRLAAALANANALRIDSPGEDFAVEKRLLERGIPAAEAEGCLVFNARQLRELRDDHGRILAPRQWYLGWRAALAEWSKMLRQFPGMRLLNSPAAIQTMFDKPSCQQLLRAQRLPTADLLLANVSGYEELVAAMEREGMRRVFVKLAHGSSASGVIAFERGKHRQRATSTTEVVRERGAVALYNSLAPQLYTTPGAIAELIDAICRHRAYAERWLPKAIDDDYAFDLRIVVIGDRARHTVVRQSRRPMTNLHLGNRRGDLQRTQSRLGDAWPAIQTTAQAATRCLAGADSAGVDVLVLPDFRRHVVLELNAFGDLLPGVTCEGQSTYDLQLEHLASKPASGAAR